MLTISAGLCSLTTEYQITCYSTSIFSQVSCCDGPDRTSTCITGSGRVACSAGSFLACCPSLPSYSSLPAFTGPSPPAPAVTEPPLSPPTLTSTPPVIEPPPPVTEPPPPPVTEPPPPPDFLIQSPDTEPPSPVLTEAPPPVLTPSFARAPAPAAQADEGSATTLPAETPAAASPSSEPPAAPSVVPVPEVTFAAAIAVAMPPPTPLSPGPEPTAIPALELGSTPTLVSTTPEDTATPTPEVTAAPTPEATAAPTPEPTAAPTPEVTAAPPPEPTAAPTPEPTAAPTPEDTAAPTPEPTPAATVAATPAEPASAFQGAVDQINQYRALHSANALTVSPVLEQYAQSWANKGQFEHSDGSYGEHNLPLCAILLMQTVNDGCNKDEQVHSASDHSCLHR